MTWTPNPMRRHHEHCRRVRERMSDSVDGDLDHPTASAVARHTRICPNCRRMLTNLSRVVAGLHALRDLPPGSDASHDHG